MRPFAIAGIQLRGTGTDNREHLKVKVRETVLRFPWVDLIMLPELAPFGAGTRFAQSIPGELTEDVGKLAQEIKRWLLLGSMYERKDDNVYNTAVVFAPDGQIYARYRKRYPWLPYEDKIAPGTEPVVFEIPQVGHFGLSICYDMWFPETIRDLVWQGAEVILHPTLTGTIDRETEVAMAQAHAATQQCYFFDINGVGTLGNGRSVICDPHGRVLHRAGEDETILPIQLDLDEVTRSRETGVMGLGQPLKQFRDQPRNFQCNKPNLPSWLQQLGPLRKPHASAPPYPDQQETK